MGLVSCYFRNSDWKFCYCFSLCVIDLFLEIRRKGKDDCDFDDFDIGSKGS